MPRKRAWLTSYRSLIAFGCICVDLNQHSACERRRRSRGKIVNELETVSLC
jgi:hypothetical protein